MAFNGSEGSPIDPAKASEWTSAYREATPAGLLAHFIGREILQDLLNQDGCKGIRFYYALHDGVQQLIAVGADNEENDQIGAGFTVADDSVSSPPRTGRANILNS